MPLIEKPTSAQLGKLTKEELIHLLFSMDKPTFSLYNDCPLCNSIRKKLEKNQ